MAGLKLLRGANVPGPSGSSSALDVLIEDGRIASVAPSISPPDGAELVDLSGLLLAAGFIDVHVHGGGGISLMSGEAADIRRYAEWAPAHGVTAFLATICAENVEAGIACAEAVAAAMKQTPSGARILGLNFEGPFVSPERRGALPRKWLQKPHRKLFDRLLATAAVRVMTIAPELDGAFDLIAATREAGVTVSIGHSDASYDIAKRAFESGASHVTHAFNAMRPLHHRDPGIIGAAIENEGVTIEAIADGVHLHPATVQMLARAAGERLCLVTDAVSPAGLGTGTFRIGGEDAVLRDDSIRLPDGTIAGSAATMDACVRNVHEWLGASGPDALTMASDVPARVAGAADRLGTITAGYDADLVALTSDLRIARTWVAGQLVYSSDG